MLNNSIVKQKKKEKCVFFLINLIRVQYLNYIQRLTNQHGTKIETIEMTSKCFKGKPFKCWMSWVVNGVLKGKLLLSYISIFHTSHFASLKQLMLVFRSIFTSNII